MTEPAVAESFPCPADHPGDAYSSTCPCRDLLDIVANKWSALAIGALADDTLRFGQIQRRLEGISPKVLTSVLRRLEAGGLVHREILPAVPLHVEYSLTPFGRTALAPLDAMRAWAEANVHHAQDLRARSARPA